MLQTQNKVTVELAPKKLQGFWMGNGLHGSPRLRTDERTLFRVHVNMHMCPARTLPFMPRTHVNVQVYEAIERIRRLGLIFQ